MNADQKKSGKQCFQLPVEIENAVSKAYWSAIKNAYDSRRTQINKSENSIFDCQLQSETLILSLINPQSSPVWQY